MKPKHQWRYPLVYAQIIVISGGGIIDNLDFLILFCYGAISFSHGWPDNQRFVSKDSLKLSVEVNTKVELGVIVREITWSVENIWIF